MFAAIFVFLIRQLIVIFLELTVAEREASSFYLQGRLPCGKTDKIRLTNKSYE